MIVNYAELHLGAAEPSTTFAPMNALSLRAITGEGHLKKIADPNIDKAQYIADSVSLRRYAGHLGLAGNMLTPMAINPGDPSNPVELFTITRPDSINYNGFLTLFAQQLFEKDEQKQRFTYFALLPESPQIGKSVNRVAFNEQNIKLRVFYTRPNQPTQ
jgi:hypothetical protein